MPEIQKPAEAPAAPVQIEMTLTEFCTRLSVGDGRVELIGGFEHSEIAAGNVKGTESEFSARYAAFCTKPVK